MAVNVGNATAAKIIAATIDDHMWNVHNTGANPVTLGKTSALVAGQGFTLASATTIPVDLEGGEELYGICGAGLTTTIEVLWQRGRDNREEPDEHRSTTRAHADAGPAARRPAARHARARAARLDRARRTRARASADRGCARAHAGQRRRLTTSRT
jgi:hypothetical protein